MGSNAHRSHFAPRSLPTQVPMPTRVPILAIILTMTATTALAASKRAHKPTRCEVRIHQPAASVVLNRTTAPASICIQGCDAKLVGVHREAGQLAALAIYSGRRCRSADGSPAQPDPQPKSKAKKKLKSKPAAKSEPGLGNAVPSLHDGSISRERHRWKPAAQR